LDLVDELGQHVGEVRHRICAVQVSTNEASIAQVSAPSLLPAKSAFLGGDRAHGAVTVLEWMSIRPSSRKRTSPSHRLRL